MRIGVPREIKAGEQRVGLTPAGVRELVDAGHRLMVETGAGAGSGVPDELYESAGASMAPDPAEVYKSSDMIVKVKEPQPAEFSRLRDGQVLFTFLHLAADPDLTAGLLATGAACVAYETVTDAAGRLPLLTPMSQVAGKLSTQAGAWALESTRGGAGVLLGGVPGVAAARVVVIGGGVVGTNAAQVAVGMGADVTVLDRDLGVLAGFETRFGARMRTLYSTADAVEAAVRSADLVIVAVLRRGERAPGVVSAEMVRSMQPGSVLVDVAIDQGGACETSRPTTHEDPTYIVDDVVHYCVANIPGCVPQTSTRALTHATLPYILRLADDPRSALIDDPYLREGLNALGGRVTNASVADSLGTSHVDPLGALENWRVDARRSSAA